MAAFKDKKNGSWYVQFRYTDWRGERQQKLKRGFATKKEAQAWEREFLMQKQADVNMSFESFVALYEKDVKPKLKLNTWLSKEHIIRTKILPYFKKRKLSEITARDVIFDAKFSSRANIKKYSLPEVIRKYSCETSVASRSGAPKMVWVLQGRVNSSENAIWKYHNSQLASAYRPITSFGIVSVNTAVEIRQRLWNEIRNSISLLQ